MNEKYLESIVGSISEDLESVRKGTFREAGFKSIQNKASEFGFIVSAEELKEDSNTLYYLIEQTCTRAAQLTSIFEILETIIDDVNYSSMCAEDRKQLVKTIDQIDMLSLCGKKAVDEVVNRLNAIFRLNYLREEK